MYNKFAEEHVLNYIQNLQVHKPRVNKKKNKNEKRKQKQKLNRAIAQYECACMWSKTNF